MKILSVVGARPQFVKFSVVSRAVRRVPEFREFLVHTGQHYDRNMSAIFFKELGIRKPDVNLGIGSGSHGSQTGSMLVALERVMLKEHPDWVVVYGDTNSTLAGALAAAKLRIPVAHVEAGLRSYNRAMPEETNRVIADHVADLLLAPTRASVANLRREGIDPRKIVRVGDVMYDAARFYAEKAQCVSRVHGRLQLNTGQYVLATIHRAENTESIPRLHAIFGALRRLAREIVVVVPIHPRTRKVLARSGWRASGGLHLIDPVGYLDMVMLERGARLIATDSGGMQKEAYFYRVPCATLRAETEWVELVEMGWNRLVPVVDHRTVYRELQSMMTSFRRPSLLSAPYGNGHTAELIVKALRDRCPSRP